MSEIIIEGVPVTFTAKEIRAIYPYVAKFYGFDYRLILLELHSAFIISDHNEYTPIFSQSDNIDFLPDDFEIKFSVAQLGDLWQLKELYPFLQNETLFETLAFSLNFIPRLKDKGFNYDVLDANRHESDIYEEQLKVVAYLNDNKMPNGCKSFKREIAIRYGLNETLKIDNTDNWLSNIILRQYGHLLEGLPEEVHKPTRAPQIHNFIAYNTFLFIVELVGSETKSNAEFSKFIIDFCQLCGIELIGRQATTEGITDLIKSSKRQYNSKPIPFSLVR